VCPSGKPLEEQGIQVEAGGQLEHGAAATDVLVVVLDAGIVVVAVAAAAARAAYRVLGMSMSAQALRVDASAHQSAANLLAQDIVSMNGKITRR
jgi:uncharacterized protein (DUF169 family)